MTGGPASAEAITAQLRRLLAEITGRDDVLEMPAATPLFGAGVGLDSLTGTMLLREVKRTYAVDVAADDLNLDSLQSLAALAEFITAHLSQAS